ncbi:MAG: ADP-ribosylglycohydrolase family protein [Planctomycetes bacterium]|nr:ADP-ribosylglycohydrolase family protein [Planctomycetota bacterium]
MRDREDVIAGALLGTAVGDALGLPLEGLSPRRAARLFPGPVRHRFVAGRGLLSDDTEHACLVGQALLASGGDPPRLARSLGWRLRGWLLGLPGGVGWATLRACLKLWLGFGPTRSGVRSAGNGPAMRAPLLGACAGDDDARLAAWVAAATRVTHTDPRAEEGALAVALAAREGARLGPAGLAPAAFVAALPEEIARLRGEAATPDLRRALEQVAAHLDRPGADLARAMGLERGVTGYVLHTVPVALHVWLRHPGDPRAALTEVLALGGDADTVGAIAGGLVGATAGAAALPPEWVDGIADWPRSVTWLRRLAARLARRFPARGQGEALAPLPLAWPALLPRNALFMLLVLAHGLRRLLPPY